MSLPPGYAYLSIPRADWNNPKIDLVKTAIIVADEGDCAVQTLNRGGHFFSYNDANKNCWPKNPLPGFTDRSMLFPNSPSTFFELPGTDFEFMFDMLKQNAVGLSKDQCVDLCRKTSGCVVSTRLTSGVCSLKEPIYSGDINPLSSAGVVYKLPPCVAVTVCSASQCGTTVTDNCGNPLACPSCEIGKIVVTSSSSTPVTSLVTSSVPPLPTGATVVVVVTGTNSAQQGKDTTSGGNQNIGLIAGVAAGILLLLGIAFFVCWNKKKQPDSRIDSDREELVMNPQHHGAKAINNSTVAATRELDPTLPQYQYTTSPDIESSLAETNARNVQAVPGFYRAIVDHQPLKPGQLPLTVDMRLYVTSIDNHGWCKALVGNQQGFVHADMLGPVG